MKECNKCETKKNLIEFSKDANSKDFYRNECKDCNKKYRYENKERIKKQHREYYSENKERINKMAIIYREENKEYIKEYMKEYYIENKEALLYKSSIYYKENKECVDEHHRKYYYENKEKISMQKKTYWKENREELCERKSVYREKNREFINNKMRNSRKNNTERYKKYWYNYKKKYTHIISWRSILNYTLNVMNLEKTGRTINILGYNAEDLKKHIESLFVEGMSWVNRSEWHIDHKIPLTAFKEDTPISVVNSLENLQPLWSYDNLSKGDKILDEYKTMDIYIKYCTKNNK